MNYIVDAYNTMRELSHYIYNWNNVDEVESAVDHYKRDNWFSKIYVDFGSSRVVVIGENFVVKWDYNEMAKFNIGGCEEELAFYEYARRCDRDYLLAPVSCIYLNGIFLYVMPRVYNVGRIRQTLFTLLNDDDYSWLMGNVGDDLHSANWGVDCYDNVKIIDYACYNKKSIS